MAVRRIPTTPPRWREVTPTVFVGRLRETRLVAEAWRDAEQGVRQVLLVGSEPGGGKSRLLAETATTLGALGAAILDGSCSADLGAAYEPFLGPVTTLLPALVDGSLPLAPGARLGPERVVDLLHAVADAPTSAARGDPVHRQDVLDAVVESLRAAAARSPVVLLLEDLHWAGETALQLLTYVVERTADVRLLVLATHRSTAPDRSALLVHHLAATYRLDGVRRLDLSPLGAEDITEYLVREGGVPAARAREAAPLLRERTGGNPFFLRELWRDLAARTDDAGGSGASAWHAPQSVQDTLEDRLGTLSPHARGSLELAAVIGDVIPIALLVEACDQETVVTLEGLDDALERHLLEPVPGREGDLRFPHTLTREVVLDLLPSSRRATLHARVAQTLEQRGPPTPAVVRQLARHYAAAHLLGHVERAVHYLGEAARLASAGLAHEEAAALDERAAELEPDADAADALRLSAARSYILAGDLGSARRVAEVVAARSDSAHRLAGATAFEESAWRTAQSGERAVELLTGALARTVERPGSRAHVRALAGLGRALANTGRPDESRRLAAQTIHDARALEDPALLADVLQASLFEGTSPAAAATKLARAEELSAYCYRTGDLWNLGPAAYYRSVLAYLLGDPVGLLRAQADLEHTAEATRQQYFGYFARCPDFGRQLVTGRFDEALATCESLLGDGESFESASSDRGDGPYGIRQFMVRREMGALGPVRSLVRGDEDPRALWAPGLLALYTALDLEEPARRVLRWVLDTDLERQQASGTWPGVLAFLCEAATHLEDRRAAGALRPMLDEHTGTNLVLSPFLALFGSADRFIGDLDSLLGTGDPERSFAAAEAMDTRMDAPVHVALSRAAHVAHHHRHGPGACDVASIERSVRAVAAELGLVRVLRALGDHPPTGHPRPRRPDGLTARELEVLRLLARGRTNREVASALFISESTAANHVRSILMKTRCENRTQAALYAADLGLGG